MGIAVDQHLEQIGAGVLVSFGGLVRSSLERRLKRGVGRVVGPHILTTVLGSVGPFNPAVRPSCQGHLWNLLTRGSSGQLGTPALSEGIGLAKI